MGQPEQNLLEIILPVGEDCEELGERLRIG